MTSDEFRKAVLNKAQGLPDWAVGVSINACIDWGLTDPGHVQRCVDLAQRFANAEAAARRQSAAQAVPVVLTSRQRIDQIQPQVKQLRSELFRRATPPFSSSAAAARWVVNQAPKKARLTGAEMRECENLFVKIDTLRDRYNRIRRREGQGRELHLSEVVRQLPYPVAGAPGVEQVVVLGAPALERLEFVTGRLAQWTGFRQADIVAYVLTGAEPSLPKVRATITYGRPSDGALQPGQSIPTIPRKSIVLETFAPLTYVQARQIYRETQRLWGARFRKSITSKDRELLDFMESTKGSSWEIRRQKWNELHPDHRYGTGRGLKIRWMRLQKRLKGLGRNLPPNAKG